VLEAGTDLRTIQLRWTKQRSAGSGACTVEHEIGEIDRRTPVAGFARLPLPTPC